MPPEDDQAESEPPRKTSSREQKKDRVGRFVEFHPVLAASITSAVLGGSTLIGGIVWITDEFKEVRKEISQEIEDESADLKKDLADIKIQTTNIRVETAKLSAKVEEHERRLNKIGATLGIDDAGAPDADSAGYPWPPDHAERMDEFCSKRCKSDANCRLECAGAYNKCGIKHLSDMRLAEFRECVKEIKVGAP
jgi:hypothetical protein